METGIFQIAFAVVVCTEVVVRQIHPSQSAISFSEIEDSLRIIRFEGDEPIEGRVCPGQIAEFHLCSAH